ncbi:MAG: hypothetical protein mread185_000660 [Mycoplasmataceae bacterium]|nr:MAG: hypothetical protein mread185_000660 [Mycoplasmataceae bacterium]
MRKEANFYRRLWKQLFDADDENYLRIDQLKKQLISHEITPESRIVKVQEHYATLSDQELTDEVEQLSNQIETPNKD